MRSLSSGFVRDLSHRRAGRGPCRIHDRTLISSYPQADSEVQNLAACLSVIPNTVAGPRKQEQNQGTRLVSP
ncbi:hypothetical protein NDU88_000182 [Pleurodeles waltl]|uniref:Uncharacterized protein n=1 Tax=Pleurodeles waltl TaxID=8319 RepID=A0AAV7MJQ6_PLEWA|nr:hypothetical protein NDU88_000182 [Pleurodeles waltl]